MNDLLTGIGWMFGFIGLAVLCNGGQIVEAWRDYLLSRKDRP